MFSASVTGSFFNKNSINPFLSPIPVVIVCERFALSAFFQNAADTTRLNLIDVKERVHIQREDGKSMEIDIVANSNCGRVVLVEVKKTQDKTGFKTVEDFQEKVEIYKTLFPEKTILPFYR